MKRRIPTRTTAHWLLVALTGAVVACSERRAPLSTVTRDSAGVRITESSAPTWTTDTGAWTIVPEPDLTIGVAAGDSLYELHAVVDAIRLEDGRIVVADARASQLRFFDRNGMFVRGVGRDGEGPGEFRNLGAVWRLGDDSIAAYDRALRRVTVFDTAGTLSRMATLAAAGDGLSPAAAGIFADGTFLVHAAPLVTPADGDGVHRKEGALIHYSAHGEPLHRIAALAGEEWVGVETQQGRALMLRPFARNGFAALANDLVYAADSDRFEVRILDRDGSLRSIVRRTGALAAVGAEDIAQYTADRLQAVPAEYRAGVQAQLAATSFPETWPAFNGLLVDAIGNVWLARPRRGPEAIAAFSVFAADGEWLGEVVAPARTRVLVIGPDWLLGRHTDDVGVQRIVLHRVSKENR